MRPHHTGPVDIYLPTRDTPYWSTVTREQEDGWGNSGEYLYGAGGGSYDGKPTWTLEEAIEVARVQYPKASVLIFKRRGTRATNYKDVEVRRIVI